MLAWCEFKRREPELAARGLVLHHQFFVAFLATVRRNGSPRLHPVTPIITEDGIYVAINEQSPKRWDMSRDRRYALHFMLGESDEEFVITGIVLQHRSQTIREAIREAADHIIRESDLLFEFLIETCLWGYWENVGQPDTRPVRRIWRLDSN